MKVNQNNYKALCQSKKKKIHKHKVKKDTGRFENSLFEKCLEVLGPKSICTKEVKAIISSTNRT